MKLSVFSSKILSEKSFSEKIDSYKLLTRKGGFLQVIVVRVIYNMIKLLLE